MSIDTGSDTLGGAVFSTGKGNVVVTILNPVSANLRPPIRVEHQATIIPSSIYLMTTNGDILIGGYRQFGKVVNLGTLPPGELVFALKTSDNYTLKTGPSSRNPDKLPHAVVRTFKSGTMQIWFEDAPGPKGTGRSDADFEDVVLQLTGGVSNGANSTAVADLLQVIKEQKGEARDAAIKALKRIDPKAAAEAGFR